MGQFRPPKTTGHMHVQYLFDLETSCMSAAFAGQVCPAERVEDMDVNQNCLQTQVTVQNTPHLNFT